MLAQAGCASCAMPPCLWEVVTLPKPDIRPLVCSCSCMICVDRLKCVRRQQLLPADRHAAQRLGDAGL